MDCRSSFDIDAGASDACEVFAYDDSSQAKICTPEWRTSGEKAGFEISEKGHEEEEEFRRAEGGGRSFRVSEFQSFGGRRPEFRREDEDEYRSFGGLC
jgi:DNA-binding PadR family transcriptional regulator